MLFLLQVDTVNAPVVDSAAQSLSLFDLIIKGGVVMIPIFILSFLAVYFIIERFMFIRANTVVDPTVARNFKTALQSADVKSAAAALRTTDSTYTRIFQHALNRLGSPLRDIESQLESAGNIEVGKLTRNLNYLGIIAGIAPMLGFIGTISGIIRIFYNISVTDNISIGVISGGLYEKMITSAAGLVVGIIAYTGYHILQGMVHRFTDRLEVESFDFLNIIQQPAK